MEKVFQSSLFGYSKKSVIAYVAEMNEEFSRKLLEKDLENKRTVQELKDQMEELKRENERLRAGRQEVAGALIDAKTFAGALMEKAEADSRARRAKNETYHQAEFQRLQALSANVDALRDAFRAAVSGMDEEMARYERRCRAAEEDFRQEALDSPAAMEADGHEDQTLG